MKEVKVMIMDKEYKIRDKYQCMIKIKEDMREVVI
jgi:hypothetical protein